MAALLKNNLCDSCGQSHDLFLEYSDSFSGAEYEYKCPQTGKKIVFRTMEWSQTIHFQPVGSVVTANSGSKKKSRPGTTA